MEGKKGECDCRYTHLAGGDNVYKDPAGWRIVFKAKFSCYSHPQRTKRKLLALPDFWRCRVLKSFLHRERASEHSSCYPNCRADILAPAGTSWCKLASPPENLWRNFVSLLRKKNNKKRNAGIEIALRGLLWAHHLWDRRCFCVVAKLGFANCMGWRVHVLLP